MQRLLERTVGRVARTLGRRPLRARRRVFHYEHVLGTSFELQVVAEAVQPARRAEAAALAEVDRLEAILSGWSATSELARWLATYDEAVPVSPELMEVLQASERWRERTAGAFDPGAQAIIEWLRDGTSADAAPDCSSDRLAPLWSLDRASGTACRRSRRAVSLDAIAKGYIVTRAAARARAVDGVSDVLLNVGGDIQHFGERAVAVAIADPFCPAENAAPIALVRIRDQAVATSGGYRRGFLLDGRRISHIVDPRTGRPAEHVASASVLAPDGATADALSTAFSVLEPSASVAIADALPDVGCLLVAQDGTVVTNAAWDARASTNEVPDTTHSRF